LPSNVTGFLALDGDPSVHGAVTQSIGNSTTGFLTVGQQYELDFYWAATQLTDRSGNTWERLDVQLGNSPVQSVSYGSATDLKLPTHGFSGWAYESMIFTATNATETLSFLSQGGPNGEPPMNLLADVSLQAVPEPSSLALSALGIVGLYLVRARRQAKSTV
jgi:PEP-CTERM motif